MTEIIPDTSKYTDLPNKLRALALILEFPDIEQREIFHSGRWQYGGTDTEAVVRSFGATRNYPEYRIKPKPRELWVTFNRTGEIVSCDTDCPSVASQYDTVARFVEQPE